MNTAKLALVDTPAEPALSPAAQRLQAHADAMRQDAQEALEALMTQLMWCAAEARSLAEIDRVWGDKTRDILRQVSSAAGSSHDMLSKRPAKD
ncbi:hypothetical protein KIKIMORA_02270 [Brevundimonas phage vB_BpoS-Kikimora]|uniref:Uncharacterized protein n=1 Tax=Brevundimonas phage vB_BpoS-Kikimora TaxID=2948601 RepID=A0A9E7MS36_9CAUD|nr:hypothetical protein KIKIMORA_02270 [Brevundimonas phage vB_BpoS-Kikimora]